MIWLKIAKILNNNVVTTFDKETKGEKVVMGRGIAFGKKVGQLIEEERIEKVFIIQDKGDNLSFQKLIKDIPIEHVKAAEEIINMAKSKLDTSFSDHIYVSLTDHISFSISRDKDNIKVQNPLLYEIKRIYKDEFDVAVKAVKIINERFGSTLDENEAGFIALHFVEASMGKTSGKTLEIMELVNHLFRIIEDYFGIKLREDTLSFSRLMAHLKYFTLRIISGKTFTEENCPLLKYILDNHKSEYQCSLKVKEYVEKNYDIYIGTAELAYLSLHICRALKANKVK